MANANPTPEATNQVAEVQPALFNEANAAKYLGRTKSWLRNQRSIDNIRRDEDGLPPLGPPYIVMGSRSVFYRHDALDAWIESNSETPAAGAAGGAS